MERRTMILLCTGLTILVLGIMWGQVLFPMLLQKKVKGKIRLEEDGDLYGRWKDIKIPIFMKVYIFTITNPEEFAIGEKPELKQLGPYIYQQKRQKVVEEISLENDSVLYRPKITYFFREDMSSGSQYDVINIINVPLVSVAAKAMSSGAVTRYLISEIVENHADEEPLFLQKTVDELLFSGYHEPVIAALSSLSGEELMPDNRFGIYYGKNGTAQDLLEIYSGVVENEKFGNTISWKGATELELWNSEFCNRINGSDGSIFPPFVTRDRIVRIFSPDMCRSIYMTYNADVELKGIPAYRFTTPKEVLQDPRIYPENVCYCKDPGNDFKGCSKAGVFKLAACRKGAPVVASWPHFYDGDEEYQSQSIGLSPNREEHETFISLEPTTGALLQASKRFQINLELKPNKYFKELKKVPSMLLPLLWVDESVSLTDENAQMIQDQLIKTTKIAGYVMYILLGIGSLILIVTFILMAVSKKNANNKA